MKPQEVLSPDDDKNYRNVRSVAVLFIVLGSVLVLGGIGLALDEKRAREEQIHPLLGVGVVVVGFAGAIGGIATLSGADSGLP